MKINKYLVFDMFGYRNKVVQEDLERLYSSSIPWDLLDNKSFLITGANGMIATYVVYILMYLVLRCKKNIQVFALSRNKEKSLELFREFIDDSHFSLLSQDVCESIRMNHNIDYVFHFAGNASPFYIKHDPVGIMKSNLLGTLNILELSKELAVQKVIFASTREVYGENNNEITLSEDSFGYLNPLDARSCYPESKRAAETLLKGYYLQYEVNFNSVRIAHSYGPGMKLANDGRVMADLLHCVVNNQNIVLKSKGDALRSFCYVTDTVNGLFRILLEGQSGEAYNLANETEEVSIRNLAEMLICQSGNENLKIESHIPEGKQMEYCDYKRVGLNTEKIERLGWKPEVNLKKGIERTVKSFEV